MVIFHSFFVCLPEGNQVSLFLLGATKHGEAVIVFSTRCVMSKDSQFIDDNHSQHLG